MKIRTGFVSNSSTSSFVLLARKSTVDSLLNTYVVTPEYAEDVEVVRPFEEVIKQYFGQIDSVMGTEVYVHAEVCAHDYNPAMDDFSSNEIEEIYNFTAKIPKKDTFEVSTDQ